MYYKSLLSNQRSNLSIQHKTVTKSIGEIRWYGK